MPEYLATYTIFADLYKQGFFVPDPKPHRQQYKFEAVDPEEAFIKARDYMKNFIGTFFNAKSQISKLLDVDSLEEIINKDH